MLWFERTIKTVEWNRVVYKYEQLQRYNHRSRKCPNTAQKRKQATEKEGQINCVVSKSRRIQEVLNQPTHPTDTRSGLSHDDSLTQVVPKSGQNQETVLTAGKDINETIVHMNTVMLRQHKFCNFDFPTAIMHLFTSEKWFLSTRWGSNPQPSDDR